MFLRTTDAIRLTLDLPPPPPPRDMQGGITFNASQVLWHNTFCRLGIFQYLRVIAQRMARKRKQ